jgi:hypothetical protein
MVASKKTCPLPHLDPGTCDYDCIWKKGSLQCDEGKDLKMRACWIIRVALNPITSVVMEMPRG